MTDDRPKGDDLLVTEGEIAADYLEALMDIADLTGDIEMDVEGGRAVVSLIEIAPGDLGVLVGDEGAVLEALQELARLATTRETGERSRLMLDVAGFRAARRAELVALAQDAVAEAQRTGAPVRLDPMSAFERKVVHDAVAAAGLSSESEGEDPARYVVVRTA
jgi:spoIIIJ-associated protein